MSKSKPSKKKNIVFFLGAGFTKGVWAKAPLTAEFVERIFAEFDEFASEGDHSVWAACDEVLGTFFGEVRNKRSLDVELLLGLLFRIRKRHLNKKLKKNVEIFHDALNAAIGRAVHYTLPITQTLTPRPMRDLHYILGECRKSFGTISIVTTNYDLIVDKINQCLIDNDLGYKRYYSKSTNIKKKLPGDLARYQYGVPVGAIFKVENLKGSSKTLRAIECQYHGHKKWRKLPAQIQIFKLHGSVNWAHCDQCKKQIHLPERLDDLKYVFSRARVRCVFHGKPYKRIIIPPMALKELQNIDPILEPIWVNAEKTIADADIVVFIGYGLPAQDPHVIEMILRARAKAIDTGHDWKYWVVDPNESTRQRYKQTFGAPARPILEPFDPTVFRAHYLSKLLSLT